MGLSANSQRVFLFRLFCPHLDDSVYGYRIIHRFRLGEIKGSDFLIRFRLRTSPDNNNPYHDIFNRYLRKSTLINMTTLEQGTSMELAFSITFKHSYQQGEFLRELNAIGGIEHATLIAADEGEMS